MRTLLIIPAYNAAPALASLLPGVLDRWDARDILVVDDGSTDGTAAAARGSGVPVARQETNAGKGAALQRGFAHAILNGYDAVITIDADGQHPPGIIPRLLGTAARGGYDVVIASRRRQFGRMRWERALSNRLTTTVVSLLAGVRIEDSQCGFRLIRSGLLRRLALSAGGFQAESELLIQAGRLGARIGHLECPAIPGNASHIRHLSDTLRFVQMCLRYL
jgi:glycosyltransferase involved in cell wall biosynthesis